MQNERRKLPDPKGKPTGAGGGGSYGGPGSSEWPKDYLKGGYFTPEGNPRKELVTEVARQIARILQARGMSTNQMRAFFHAVRGIEYRLKIGEEFGAVEQDLHALWAMASERREKEKVPPEFVRFIKENLDRVHDKHSLVKGFLPHMEAVVALHYKKGA